MHKLLFAPLCLIFSLVFLGACSESGENGNSPKKEHHDSGDQPLTEKPTKHEAVVDKATEPAPAIKVLEFDDVEVPELDYRGNIEAGLYWEDQLGLNYILICNESNSQIEPDLFRTKLFAYHYQKANGSDQWDQVWSYVDFNRPKDAAYILYDQTFTVTDLNQDGMGEACFIYQREVEEDPEFKVVAISTINISQGKTESFFVKGSVPSSLSSDYDQQVKKEVVENASIENHKLYEDHASKIWDQHNANWKGILENL